jgi:hypothetical protein
VKPFVLGQKHFREGKLGANPFKPNSEKAKSYEHGFNRAYFENLTKVQAEERRGQAEDNNR